MYTLPSTLEEEIINYGLLIRDFRKGRIEPVKFKAVRVPMGIYEQREDDTYMVRVRCAGGFISPLQLKNVTRSATKYNVKSVHITTRQEIQLHNIKLEETFNVLKELHEIGLASRGGGGNTVRNIMGSVDAGISPNEVFDVTPYVIALTDKLISENDSRQLS